MALVVRRHCSRGYELYCCNTEGDINSVVSQASCRMDVTRLHRAYSGLWTLCRITSKIYEYEYGLFLIYLKVS